MEGSILTLLEQHGPLAYDQIAAHLAEPPAAVQRALADLRARGLIEALSHGRRGGHLITAADYWQLTDEGRSELARLPVTAIHVDPPSGSGREWSGRPPSSVRARRSSRTGLIPGGAAAHSEKTDGTAKTCGAFPQLGNARKFHFATSVWPPSRCVSRSSATARRFTRGELSPSCADRGHATATLERSDAVSLSRSCCREGVRNRACATNG